MPTPRSQPPRRGDWGLTEPSERTHLQFVKQEFYFDTGSISTVAETAIQVPFLETFLFVCLGRLYNSSLPAHPQSQKERAANSTDV